MKSLGFISTAPPLIRSSSFRSLSRTNLNRFTLKCPTSLYLPSPMKRCSFSNSENPSSSNDGNASITVLEDESINNYKLQVGSPISFNPLAKLSSSDQAFFLLAFIACTTSVAFTSFVIAAIPTLMAMSRVATSFAKLADTARKELPSTMAAIRLSGMEISDLTSELSDLSQDITDGMNNSVKAVQAAEAGIKQIGTLAHQQTLSMIEERASLPEISLSGAAKKTSHAIGRATKSLMNIVTKGDRDEDDSSL